MFTTNVRVAAVVLAVCTSACSEMSSPVAPPEGTLPGGDSSAALTRDERVSLAGVRAATAAFHNLDKAIAAGYASPVGGVCDQSPAGAMGVHAPNPLLIQSPGVSAETPEVLLYLPTGGGNYRLVGVEYLQPVVLRDTRTGDIVGPWFAPTPWPAHYVPAGPAPTLFGQAFQGPMPGHVPGMPWHYDLHVWLWAPNPAGVFAQWNPSISCS